MSTMTRAQLADREVIMTAKTSIGAGLALALALSTIAVAQEIKLTLADQNSGTAFGPTNAVKPWIAQVEKATNGRVKIELYSSQTLLKGIDTWKGVASGIADMGWCVQSYWPDLTPLAEVMTLPGLPMKSAEHGSEVLWKLYEKFPAIQREFSAIQPILLHTTDPYFLLTTKKQVKTLEDIKGLKIRAIGGPGTDHMKALGAVPIAIPMPDVYQALDKGVVDATRLAASSALGRMIEADEVAVPVDVVYKRVERSVRNFAALFIASGFLAGLFLQVASSMQRLRSEESASYISPHASVSEEAGLIRVEASAFDAIYAALGDNETLQNLFLNQTSSEDFIDVYEQMLPDHSGGPLMSLSAGVDAVTRALTGRNASAAPRRSPSWRRPGPGSSRRSRTRWPT